MQAPSPQALWLAAAWSTVVAGPAAALTFIAGSIPSFHCEPKLLCLRASVDRASSTFLFQVLLLLTFCAVLWKARFLAKPLNAPTKSLVRAALLSAVLSTLIVGALLTGMHAVMDGRVDALGGLLAIAAGGTVTSALLWRVLRAANGP